MARQSTKACLQIFNAVPLCSLWAFRIYIGNRFMFCKPCWLLVLFWMVQSYTILNNAKWGSESSVALPNGRLIVLCFYDPSACKLGSTVTLIEFSGLPCGMSAMLWLCWRSPDVHGLFICCWIVVTRQSLYGTWLGLMVSSHPGSPVVDDDSEGRVKQVDENVISNADVHM